MLGNVYQMNTVVPQDRSLPSTTAIAIATAIIAGLGGYFLGQGASIGLFSHNSSANKTASPAKKSWPNNYDVTVHPDSSDEELMTYLRGGKHDQKSREVTDSEDEENDEDIAPGPLNAFEGNREECKLVLCVRTDLGMGKGETNQTFLSSS